MTTQLRRRAHSPFLVIILVSIAPASGQSNSKHFRTAKRIAAEHCIEEPALPSFRRGTKPALAEK
jgi:hypothetical protein